MSHRTARRRRKNLRDRQDVPPAISTPLDPRNAPASSPTLFTYSDEAAADLRLVHRAVKQQWDIQPPMREWLPGAVAEKVIQTDHGDCENESDKIALSAARILADMEWQNMRLDHDLLRAIFGLP